MSWPVDLDRTLELPAEHLDDLEPLESTTSGPAERRPKRIQTVSRPYPLEERSVSDDPEEQEQLRIAREKVARKMAAQKLDSERREQEHRHALEVAEQRSRHEHRLRQGRQEAHILTAALVLMVGSGLAWIVMPVTAAAQIVFAASLGAVAGYLAGRRGG